MLLAALTLVGVGAAGDSKTFAVLDIPASTREAEFSLSHDGNSMGCLLDGSVHWWTWARGFRFMDEGSPIPRGVAISGDGSSLLAARSSELGPRPVIWLRDGSSIDIGFPAGDCNMNHLDDFGLDLNADGTLAVGQTSTCAADVAFRWSRTDGFQSLPTLEGGDSRGLAVSADGSLVAGFCERPGEDLPHPALWRNGEGPDLFLGPDVKGEATNVSANGRFVVGQATMGGLSPRAFFWQQGADPVGLGNLSGRATDSSLARAVADDGTVVGWSGDEMWGDQEAFIWSRKTGMSSVAGYLASRDVALPADMVLTAVLDISGDGKTLVGTCRDRNWKQGFWMARLGDSPDQAPPVMSNPWEPKPMDHVRPDTMDSFPADMLNPFPFGKRRF